MKHALSLFHLPYLLTMHTSEAMALGGADVFGWDGAQREGEQQGVKTGGRVYELGGVRLRHDISNILTIGKSSIVLRQITIKE